MKGAVTMGRDDNKTGGNNARSLPQTPKNQKIKPADMKEEMPASLLNSVPLNQNVNE